MELLDIVLPVLWEFYVKQSPPKTSLSINPSVPTSKETASVVVEIFC